MFYSFSLIPFQFILHHILIHISNAIPSEDDKMLIAFVRNDQKIQISQYSKQKYEAHLGIMHYMRKNWQCDKIADEFEKYERTECQKYRKYLDILYEYLNSEYKGIPTVKPKFIFKDQIEIEGPIIYVVNCLVKISQFYFNELMQEKYTYKLNEFFSWNFEPNFLNAARLNYELKLESEQKMPINEMILQMAIDTAQECQTNENLEGIIQQKFEKNFEDNFKRAEENAKEDWPRFSGVINDNKHEIIVESKYDHQWTWETDALFCEFVKGLTTNFEGFIKLIKGYDNFEKVKEDWTPKYEFHLGVVYLLRKNWQCFHIFNAFEEHEREKCQIYRKYFYILYEYLFRLYVEAKNGEEAKQLPAVKPIFFEYFLTKQILIDVIRKLNEIAKCLWKKYEKKFLNFDNILNIHLENEEELNYEMKEETNWINENVEKIIKFIRPKNVLNGPTEIEILREEFKKKMEKLCENAKANAANDEEKENLENEYNLKFGTFNSSPFL